MFLFNNKSNAVPRSRRSSIDSLVTNSLAPTSTTTSDAWVSPSSDASSSAEMPSSEQQERQQLGKRSSVFKLRSRSNTATSTASSFMSISSAMVRVESALSPDSRQFPGQNLLDFSGSKRPLFARGKRGKRRSGQLSPSAQFYDDGEVDDSSRRTSVLRRGKKAADQPENSRKSYQFENTVSLIPFQQAASSSEFRALSISNTSRIQTATTSTPLIANLTKMESWNTAPAALPRAPVMLSKASRQMTSISIISPRIALSRLSQEHHQFWDSGLQL